MIIERVVIDLNTGTCTDYTADLQSEPDAQHGIYSLTHEGYRSAWIARKEAAHV